MAREFWLRIGIDASKAQMGAKRFRRSLADVRRDAAKTHGSVRTLGTGLGKFATFITGATVGLGALSAAIGGIQVKRAIKDFADFQQNLRSVQALTGSTEEELLNLRNAALAAAEATRFDTAQSSTSLLNLARAGFTAAQSIEMLQPILELTEVSQGDLAGVTETVIAAMKGYGLEAEKSREVTDIFTSQEILT